LKHFQRVRLTDNINYEIFSLRGGENLKVNTPYVVSFVMLCV